MAFKLDTGGVVSVGYKGAPFNCVVGMRWPDLNAFTQGYVEAMFASADHPGFLDVEAGNDDAGHKRVGFSDLAPEALARIISDCECRSAPLPFEPTVEAGRKFWELRQANQQGALLPPLTIQLGDDGKVRFAA